MMVVFIAISAFPQSHDSHNGGSDKIQKDAAESHKSMKGGMMMDAMNMERHFIEKMIPHHQDAIDMAKLALEKSKKSEIKKLSQDIISSQSAEIETMKKWYKEWFGTEVPVKRMNMKGKGLGASEMMMDMSMSHDMMGGTMDDLRKSADFDKKFIEMMVKHHKGAVMMSGMLIDSRKPEMRKFGKDIITAQSGEIEMMIKWYQGWYGSW
jgi:uncharacterized protein (DUF305 family)